MKKNGVLLIAVLVSATPLRTQADVAYEGNVFPENDGWVIGRLDPSWTRSTDSGVFSTHANFKGLKTWYLRTEMPESQDVFYEWSARTTGDGGYSFMLLTLRGPSVFSEILVSLRDDDAGIHFFPDLGDPDTGDFISASTTPGHFHTFRVESDGATHVLYMDGVEILSRNLQNPLGTEVELRFGLGLEFPDRALTSEWDYVRFGVIPEPATGVLLALTAALHARRRRAPRCR